MRVGMVAALQSRAEQGSFVYSTEKRATASGHETQKLLNKLRYQSLWSTTDMVWRSSSRHALSRDGSST
jgi:hypothetical protein